MHRPLRPLLLLTLAALVLAAPARGDATTEGIALAVVFDTSGSMREPIATGEPGKMDTKYRAAQRAFSTVIDRLEMFASAPGAKPLQVGVFVFEQGRAATAVPLGAFDASKLRHWLSTLNPGGNTPLGDTLYLAGSEVLKARAESRHVLVLTDGANTAGKPPLTTLEMLKTAGARRQTPVFTHIIALDIDPQVFAALERQGATLIGADDGTRLAAQFDFILEEKILVEAPR